MDFIGCDALKIPIKKIGNYSVARKIAALVVLISPVLYITAGMILLFHIGHQ